jgi:hypothetical protein
LINGARKRGENGKTHLLHSLLLDILPGALTSGDVDKTGSGHEEERDGSVEDLQSVKKKKKRKAKKKRLLDLKSEENGFGGDSEKERQVPGSRPVKPELVCLYPFTSTSSATQRKIKQQYDQLVKCNESNALTLAQVFHFTLFFVFQFLRKISKLLCYFLEWKCLLFLCKLVCHSTNTKCMLIYNDICLENMRSIFYAPFHFLAMKKGAYIDYCLRNSFLAVLCYSCTFLCDQMIEASELVLECSEKKCA